MEQALNERLIARALGDLRNLPTPDELRGMIADAEVSAFFADQAPLPPQLLETAWILHQVGTVRPTISLYDPAQQVRANSVAAHIFDLFLSRGAEPAEALVTAFAAQISSIRGDRMPNAAAIAARLPPAEARLQEQPGRASIELSCTFLSLSRATTVSQLRRLEDEIRIADEASRPGLDAAIRVVRGVRQLLNFLTYGSPEQLEAARAAFLEAANSPSATADLDSRWVAAHLLDLVDDLGSASVWSLLPDDTPPVVGRAMALGDPPVLALWPPQVELLSGSLSNPLATTTRRAVITFPTSAGKTLLTQLIVATHLATAGTSVCVVAPTHSLCREIQRGLDRRLWLLRKSVASDGPLGAMAESQASVVVMTPERLSALLRADDQGTVDRFGLFVFDEAHLLADSSRGWSFETTLSRIHQMTESTSTRIMVVSAALGGAATVHAWLSAGTPATSSAARWRSARRLHATYEVLEHGDVRLVPASGRQRLDRAVTDLVGVLRLFDGTDGVLASRGAKVGEVQRFGARELKPPRATQLKFVVNHAAEAGPVLTIHATKQSAVRLAEAVAAERAPRAETALTRLAGQRLGVQHPLIPLLRKGVAYHHAALPVDVQAEIEDAVRSKEIDVICATSTLIEGVNLPVRTVVVVERGYYDGTDRGYVEVIDAPALMNAAGRAGRAGRETEGWVIVVHDPVPGAPSARGSILSLNVNADVESTLVSADSLAALSAYELLLAETSALVLQEVPDAVDSFLSYCWYLADASVALDPGLRAEDVLAGLKATLAWHQLPAEMASRWEALVPRLVGTFESTDEARRRRWARSGVRLSVNVALEDVAAATQETLNLLPTDSLSDPIAVLEAIVGEGRLAALLALLPERVTRFKRRRYGRTQLVHVDHAALLMDWVRGVDLSELTTRYLSEVDGDGSDDSYRFEQLASYLAQVCEHHLPWTIGTILQWTEITPEDAILPDLPSHIHYGVPDAVALLLMRRGVRSRRLAVAVGADAQASSVDTETVKAWLSTIGLANWRTLFDAAPTELADLYQFVWDENSGLGERLLSGDAVHVALEDGAESSHLVGHISYAPDGERPRRIVLTDDQGRLAATIGAASYRDVALLLDAGFELEGTTSWENPNAVEVRLLST